MHHDHTPLSPCPVCGSTPELVMCHTLWNVKCTSPGCIGYLHNEFLTRLDTVPEEPATAVTTRWNNWVGGIPAAVSEFLKKFFALPIDARRGAGLARVERVFAHMGQQVAAQHVAVEEAVVRDRRRGRG